MTRVWLWSGRSITWIKAEDDGRQHGRRAHVVQQLADAAVGGGGAELLRLGVDEVEVGVGGVLHVDGVQLRAEPRQPAAEREPCRCAARCSAASSTSRSSVKVAADRRGIVASLLDGSAHTARTQRTASTQHMGHEQRGV